jgi:hypothetical protein
VKPVKVRFPAYRRFDRARIEANNSMVGMLIAARLSGHLLQPHEGASVLLPEIYPSVEGVGLLNRTVADTQAQLASAEGDLATMALPFLQSVFEDFADESAGFCAYRGFRKTATEKRQGLAGTLDFLERCSRSHFSPEHRGLFSFLRRLRNQIIHEGSRATPPLDRDWVGLPPSAHARWLEIAGRPYEVGGDAAGRILFEAPELTVALAVTKRMALEVCGHLVAILLDRDWADIVCDDYSCSVTPLSRRSTLLRELRSFARREYQPVIPTDGSLRSALSARKVM